MWLSFIILISLIHLSINEELEERLQLIDEVIDDYKNTVYALQLIYYSEHSSVCAILAKPPTKFDPELELSFCYMVENAIFNVLKDLMFAFTALTSDRYAEFSRERYLTTVDMAIRMFRGMQPTSANRRLFELRVFFKYSSRWIKKMEQYIISKFRYTKIC